jgi:hypothetical protein
LYACQKVTVTSSAFATSGAIKDAPKAEARISAAETDTDPAFLLKLSISFLLFAVICK